MFGIIPTEYDIKVYNEQLKDFLPDTFIDGHVHLWTQEMRRGLVKHSGTQNWPDLVAPDMTIEDLMSSYETMFPSKKVLPVMMTSPTCRIDEGNKYVMDLQKNGYPYPTLYCTTPEMSKEELKTAILEKGFCGIKPFLSHSPSYIPVDEIRISDFVPAEHLEIMNELGGTVVIHVARPKRLRDSINIAQLMEIDEKYPNAKVIVAHIGRAYSPEDYIGAFEIFKNSKNLIFDFTANVLDSAMVECIKAIGTKRFIFGSDMPITKMRMYRISENGTYINVVPRGLYGDVSYDPHMRESDEDEITTFMYEELLAFKRASEQLNLSKKDVEDILFNNSVEIFNFKL